MAAWRRPPFDKRRQESAFINGRIVIASATPSCSASPDRLRQAPLRRVMSRASRIVSRAPREDSEQHDRFVCAVACCRRAIFQSIMATRFENTQISESATASAMPRKDRMHAVGHHRNRSLGTSPRLTTSSRTALLSQITVAPCGIPRRFAASSREIPRAVLELRLQQTFERIKVVARDDASVGRQMMNQMTVAVIDNMKNIEARPVARDPSWVNREPIEQFCRG